MTALLIIDNATPVPANIAGIFGLDSFSELIIRKKSIRQRLCALSEALGWGQPIILDGAPLRPNVAHRLEKHARAQKTAIYIPCYLHPAVDEEQLSGFLDKLSHSLEALAVVGRAQLPSPTNADIVNPSMLVLKGEQIVNLVAALEADEPHVDMAQLAHGLDWLESDVPFLDLRDTIQFLNAVTSTFDVRHFNQVATNDRYTITKSSSNVAKLREEFDYFTLIPAELRRFFVEPFSFTETPQGAQYKMERLLTPDFALQWLHNSVRQPAFEQFVEHIFYFLRARPSKSVDTTTAMTTAHALYIAKVKERIATLVSLDQYKAIAPYTVMAFDGPERLLRRYIGIHERLTKQRDYRTLVIGHGDLCFSNILYSGVQGTLKLIDPRGASNIDTLYTDPWYDLSKLSHSIEGRYDYINSGQYSIEINERGMPTLNIKAPSRHTEVQYFRKRCRDLGAEPRLIRLYEASLFISMTPLHIDAPLKVLAFLLNAQAILDEVDEDEVWN
jgi:hypothetical protein